MKLNIKIRKDAENTIKNWFETNRCLSLVEGGDKESKPARNKHANKSVEETKAVKEKRAEEEH